MIKTVTVFGAGSWGTALAKLLAEKPELTVKLWVRNAKTAGAVRTLRENQVYLPGVVLPERLNITDSMDDALPADLLVMALPSHGVRHIAGQISCGRGQLILSCAKGLEDNSFLRMSEIIAQECPPSVVAALSGPNHAKEVAAGQPTATVIACADEQAAARIQTVFTTAYFRPYTNTDIVGVELAGALKNIIAIALGLLDGLGYQDNIKAATMTRGLAEISRLGISLGARPITFLGLAGMGDLISTCTSKHSRNRRAGEQLAQGRGIEEIIAGTSMVVEGVRAIGSAHALAAERGVAMPITDELYKVLYENKNIKEAVNALMTRAYKAEG